MLTAEQITDALDTLRAALDPVLDLGARVTVSPVMQGPTSKGELQLFVQGSRSQVPQQETFNQPYSQLRTIQFRVNLHLKDLRDPTAALIQLEQAKGLVVGLQLFGEQPRARYEGATYPVSDGFSRLDDEAFWFYSLLLECEFEDFLPSPTLPE